MNSKTINKVFLRIALLILVVGLFLRLYKVDLPLLEFYPSRQIQTAEVTRNLYREGFSVLAPTVHYLGPQNSLFLVEFPLYNLAVASLYWLGGGVEETFGRLFSILGFIASFTLLYKLAREYTGKIGAVAALFFYTFSPLSIMVSRSFQPDQWMLAFSLASLYFLHLYLKRKGQRSDFATMALFLLSAGLASLSILLKIPAFIFTIIPAVYLLLKRGNNSLNIPGYLAVALVPVFFWYVWAVLVSRAGIVLPANTQIANWFGFEVFASPKYWSNIFGFEMNLVLLPVGMILFLFGLAVKGAIRPQFLYVWLATVILYFLIFNKHNMTHEYYHLPILPIAAIFIGGAVQKIYETISNFVVPKGWLFGGLGFFSLVLMLPPTLARAYQPIDRFKFVPEVAALIQAVTKPADLVIGSMDAGPTLVYYADRVGWTFEVNREDQTRQFAFYGTQDKIVADPIHELETLRAEGAVIFAAGNKGQFLQNRLFSQYMYKNFEVLFENENYIIFDLRQKRNVD